MGAGQFLGVYKQKGQVQKKSPTYFAGVWSICYLNTGLLISKANWYTPLNRRYSSPWEDLGGTTAIGKKTGRRKEVHVYQDERA
jgi:hypothetical protein